MRGVLAGIGLFCSAVFVQPATAHAAAGSTVTVSVTALEFPAEARYFKASGVNNGGEVAGGFADSRFIDHIGVWRNGRFTEIKSGLDLRVAGIGDNGLVVYTDTRYPGGGPPTGEPRAYGWRNGTSTILQPFGATRSAACAVDRAGEQVAMSMEYFGLLRGRLVVWHNGSFTVASPSMDDVAQTNIRAVNASGQVLFERNSSTSGWFFDGTGIHELTGFRGSQYLAVRDLNDSGQVLGEDSRYRSDRHAFIWHDGAFTDLGTLGGSASYPAIGRQGINNAGQAVGTSRTSTGATHAFRWQNGFMTDLGTLPGDVSSDALAINERGQVFGVSTGADQVSRPVLWGEDGQIHDLSDAGRNIGGNPVINDQGQVVVDAGTPAAPQPQLWTITTG